jgi:hypothetical protein
MRITEAKLTAIATCRTCSGEIVLEGTGDTIEEAEKALHEDMEDKDWTDDTCWQCNEKRFLDTADKADHDNKIQRELDP